MCFHKGPFVLVALAVLYRSLTVLFNKLNQLRKEKLYNQAVLTLLEACCNGSYQDYTLTLETPR